MVAEQINLVAGLIVRLCREERHQLALADDSTLDCLGKLLAMFAVAEGQVVPAAEIVNRNTGLSVLIPDAIPPGVSFGLVLEAISAVIADSKYRTFRFLWLPTILAVFPGTNFNPTPAAEAPWVSLEKHGLAASRPSHLGAFDYLLPAVPASQTKAHGSRYNSYIRAAQEPKSYGRRSLPRFASSSFPWNDSLNDVPSQNDADTDEVDSPIIPWLIHQVRSRPSDYEKLAAAGVLTSVFKAGSVRTSFRESAMGGLLVVPMLVEIISGYDVSTLLSDSSSSMLDPNTSLAWTVLEKTPKILAKLITDSESLLNAAYDSGALKMAANILRATYNNPIPKTHGRFWSTPPACDPAPEGPGSCHVLAAFSPSKSLEIYGLGPPGLPPGILHLARVREGVLKVICALAAGEDEWRQKLQGEHNIVPYVAECLRWTPEKPNLGFRGNKNDPRRDPDWQPTPYCVGPYGMNPPEVLTAACHAIRTLSRSLKFLRTTMVELSITVPICLFLKNERNPTPSRRDCGRM